MSTPIVCETYPGFRYPAAEISAFLYACQLNMFTIALANFSGHDWFKPVDTYHFYCWLNNHFIREIQYQKVQPPH